MIIPRNVFCGATWPRRTGMIDGWLCAFESVGWALNTQREETHFFVGGHSGDVFSFFPPLDCRFPWFIPVFVLTGSRCLKRKTRKRGAMWRGCGSEQHLNRTETQQCNKRPQTDSSDVCLSLHEGPSRSARDTMLGDTRGNGICVARERSGRRALFARISLRKPLQTTQHVGFSFTTFEISMPVNLGEAATKVDSSIYSVIWIYKLKSVYAKLRPQM